MDMEEEYQSIFLYKSEKKYFPTIEQEKRKNWIKKCKKYKIENKKLYYLHNKYKTVEVVRDKIQMDHILTEFHLEKGIHLGINRMRKRICQNYYWKTIQADVTKYVKSCHHCSKKSNQRKQNVKLAQELTFLSQKLKESKSNLNCVLSAHNEMEFKYFYLDILKPLEQSHSGFKYVALLTNTSTKWTEAEVLKDVTTDSVGNFISKNTCRYGYPISLALSQSCTDVDSDFHTRLLDKLCSYLQDHFIKVTTETQYYFYNQTVNDLLSTFITELPSLKYNWDHHISKIILSYNSFPQSNESPYYKTFNKHSCLPICLGQNNIWQWTKKILHDFKVNLGIDFHFNFSNKIK